MDALENKKGKYFCWNQSHNLLHIARLNEIFHGVKQSKKENTLSILACHTWLICYQLCKGCNHNLEMKDRRDVLCLLNSFIKLDVKVMK